MKDKEVFEIAEMILSSQSESIEEITMAHWILSHCQDVGDKQCKFGRCLIEHEGKKLCCYHCPDKDGCAFRNGISHVYCTGE